MGGLSILIVGVVLSLLLQSLLFPFAPGPSLLGWVGLVVRDTAHNFRPFPWLLPDVVEPMGAGLSSGPSWYPDPPPLMISHLEHLPSKRSRLLNSLLLISFPPLPSSPFLVHPALLFDFLFFHELHN